MPANDSNFLMWFGPGEDQFTAPLPRPFVREPEMYSPCVWVVPGDALYFYFNSTTNQALPGAKIQVQYNTQPPLDLAVSEINTITFPDGQHSYGRVVMLGNVIEGLLRLVCGNLTSQWLWMTDPVTAARHTAQVQFRNPRRLQGFRYSYLPEDFYQSFRVRLAVKGMEPDSQKEVYTESTTGKTRGYYSEPKMITNLITPDYDYWGHRAVISMLEHDNVLFNGQPFLYHTAYKSNLVVDSAYSTGEFFVSEENYSTINRS